MSQFLENTANKLESITNNVTESNGNKTNEYQALAIEQNLLPETLQVGDYIPFINIIGIGRSKEIFNYCNDKLFLILTLYDINQLPEEMHTKLFTISSKFNVIVLFHSGEPNNMKSSILYSKDSQLRKLFMVCKESFCYIASANRKIMSILNNSEIENIDKLEPNDYFQSQVHIPYLVLENALDEVLLEKVINFYKSKKKDGKLISHQHSTKDRLHVHPDTDLEKEIDHKLSRSVLPELKKVFYFDAEYRESYKICSYDGETSGRFHPHRDTPKPYQHRKYAMSLFLNDDYEGGEFHLPEYGIKMKPKANTAFIFPGISTHQVLPVTNGSRMTIITFFVNGSIKPQYKMKANFYKDKNITESEVYPL